MMDKSTEIIEILRPYFKLNLKASEAACWIRRVEVNDAISDSTAQKRF